MILAQKKNTGPLPAHERGKVPVWVRVRVRVLPGLLRSHWLLQASSLLNPRKCDAFVEHGFLCFGALR